MSETLPRATSPLPETAAYFSNSEVLLDAPKVSRDLGSVAIKGMIEVSNTTNVETSANFQGNWTNTALERMKSADFKAKFNDWVRITAAALPESLSLESREKITTDQYMTRIDEFDTAHEDVSSHVAYGPAAEYAHVPETYGTSAGFGENVALFSDAPLNSRQKDIIVAHEMYHSLVDSQGAAAKPTVLIAFDTEEITHWNNEQKAIDSGMRAPLKYMSSPDELMARMAQVKNYYGMQAGETFTQRHLDYARSHYVEDTGLDNNMTLFFRMAQDKVFIDKMNTLPL